MLETDLTMRSKGAEAEAVNHWNSAANFLRMDRVEFPDSALQLLQDSSWSIDKEYLGGVFSRYILQQPKSEESPAVLRLSIKRMMYGRKGPAIAIILNNYYPSLVKEGRVIGQVNRPDRFEACDNGIVVSRGEDSFSFTP